MLQNIKSTWIYFSLWEKLAMFFSIVVFFAVTITVYYQDLESLTIWSVNFWEVLFKEKNIFMFYEYTAKNIYGVSHQYMGCDILVCIPWALWNLPLWLIQNYGDIAILQNPLCLLYSKCFLICILCGCIKVFVEIGKFFTDNKKHIYSCALLFGTGFFPLNSVAYYGQNDIMIVLIILLAIYFMVRKKWIAFLVLSAISIAFEPYFIFSYVAIVLFKEKRIHYILSYIVSGFSLFILQKVIFWNAPMYQESLSQGPTKSIINMLFENVISITPFMASVFLASLCIIYLVSYFDDGKEDSKSLYYAFAAMSCFFLFVRYESYRPLYLYIFVSLVFLLKPQFFRINLWFEIITTGCLMLLFMYQNRNFFSSEYFCMIKRGTVLNDMVKQHLPFIQPHIYMTFYLIGIMVLLSLNHPCFKGKSTVLYMKTEPWLIFARNCLYAMPYIVSIILVYI